MTNESQNKDTEIVVAHRAMEVAEIESQIATAKRYPRDIKVFKEKLMSMANLDQETAEGCYYALPRGGKAIDGPSVRLAEIALACYQNCVAEADVLTEDDKFVYAMGQCRDLENNIAVRIKVRRRITDKEGKRYNDDMIAVTANAACAIALRNAVFKIIPGAYIKPVFDKVKETAVGKAQSLANRRAEVISRLTKFGVTEERVLGVLSRRSVDEVTFDDVAKLIGLGTAIKDGDISVEAAFPDTFKEEWHKSNQNINKQAGSETVDTPFDEKTKNKSTGDRKSASIGKQTTRKSKTTQQSAPQEQETVSEDDSEPEGEAKYLYHCNNCGADFNEPKKGARQKDICPECVSSKIVLTKDANEENTVPAFMKD